MLQEVGGRGWGRWEGRGRGSEEPCASGGRGEGMGEMGWGRERERGVMIPRWKKLKVP